MTTETNIKPFVNMNGTSKDELRYQYMNVYQKLGEVLDMMAQATPHGRDYKSNEDYMNAIREHSRNKDELYKMRDRYEATLVHIIDAQDAAVSL